MSNFKIISSYHLTLCSESMSCIPIASGWNFWKVGFKVIRQKQLINAEMKDLQLLLFPVPASDFFRQNFPASDFFRQKSQFVHACFAAALLQKSSAVCSSHAQGSACMHYGAVPTAVQCRANLHSTPCAQPKWILFQCFEIDRFWINWINWNTV